MDWQNPPLTACSVEKTLGKLVLSYIAEPYHQFWGASRKITAASIRAGPLTDPTPNPSVLQMRRKRRSWIFGWQFAVCNSPHYCQTVFQNGWSRLLPLAMTWLWQLLISHQHLALSSFLISGNLIGMIAHSHFNLCFSDHEWIWPFLHMVTGLLGFLFLKSRHKSLGSDCWSQAPRVSRMGPARGLERTSGC